MKKFFINTLNILSKLEPVFRLIEVIGIGCFGAFISVQANHIAEAQYKFAQADSQPVFLIQDFVDKNLKGEENSNETITVDLISGKAENIDISYVTYIEATAYTPDKLDFIKKKIGILDYYNVHESKGGKNGCIESAYGENNYSTYLQLYYDVLNDKNDDILYVEKSTFIKITYQDILNDKHTEYYKVNALGQEHLEEESGENIFDDCNKLENQIHVYDLSVDKLHDIFE